MIRPQFGGSAALQTLNAASLLGRRTGTGGAAEEITIGANLTMGGENGRVLSASSGTATLGDGDYGDIVVSVDGTVLSVDADAITNAKAANMATARIKGRVTAGTGDPEDLTKAQVLTFLNVEDGADVTDATNVAAAGAVMAATFDAHTILAATTDDTPAALTVGEATVVGRATGGNIAALTATQLRTIANVEDGADVTDAANVNTAGAVMEADYNAHTILAATTDNTPAALTVGEATVVGRATGGNIAALSAANVRTLINVEDGSTADQSAAEIETAYNSQVAVVSQEDAEAGTATTVTRWTAQRVGQAIAALAGVSDGDVVGPAEATDNAVARFDTTTGKLLQDSAVTIDNSGNIATAGTVDGRDVSADGATLDGIVGLADAAITTGTATTPLLITAAQTKLAAETWGPPAVGPWSLILTDAGGSIEWFSSADANSITRTSSSVSTEIYTVPANTFSADGVSVTLDIFLRALNNDGTTRSIKPTVTFGGNLVCDVEGAIASLGTNAGDRAIRLRLTIMRTSATTAFLHLAWLIGNGTTANASVDGDPYGSLGVGNYTQTVTKDITLAPGSANGIVVTLTNSISSAQLGSTVLRRILTKGFGIQ